MRPCPQPHPIPTCPTPGAYFDIDLGGCLGFGVRVPRSHAASVSSRAEREQAVCRAAFLSACAAGSGSAQHEIGSEHDEIARGEAEIAEVARGTADDEHDAGDLTGLGSQQGTMRRAIDREVASILPAGPLKLDYSRWRWYASGGGASGWLPVAEGAHASEHASAENLSAQELSGWHWETTGWIQGEPRQPEASTQRRQPPERVPSRRLSRGAKLIRRSRPAARLEARVWSVRGSWWRRLLWPAAL